MSPNPVSKNLFELAQLHINLFAIAIAPSALFAIAKLLGTK
ncbi:hypothetical protein [Pseudanabaena sp. ABRG5-3]|nr:hypothetical protein [Pseudanabaena sp. ABRG5-3]